MRWIQMDSYHHAYVGDDGRILAEVKKPVAHWYWCTLNEQWLTEQDAMTAVEKTFAQKEPPA